MKRLAHLTPFLLLTLGAFACDDKTKGGSSGGTPPPPPPPSASANLCAGGGDPVKDPVSAPFFPGTAGSYCVNGDTKAYGKDAKLTLEDVCTSAVDGGCSLYEQYHYDRFVSLRYVAGDGKGNSVDIFLSRFPTPEAAYGMFTKRVVADGDPTAASVKPLAVGGSGSISSSNVNMWKGQYLAELTFNSEDASMRPDQMAAAAKDAIVPIATELAKRLPGSADALAPVKQLPAQALLPLGVDYQLEDALGLKGAGGAAVGYYKDDAHRWRMVAFATPGAMKAVKASAGAQAVAGVGDEGASAKIEDADYVFARKGTLVVGVGNDHFADDPQKLTKDALTAKLKDWLATPSPATSSSATKH